MYFLYRRENQTTYFSMLSPQDWGSTCPHEFLGAYKLEADMSWTKAEDVAKRSKDIQMVDHLLSSQVPAIQYVMETPSNGINHSSEKIAMIEKETFSEEPLKSSDCVTTM
ncbi:uncharacterized protein C1orf50 homolog [Exaiptasia diaphana]|uniref:Uncharacterized protein n=1 Tax=Exaiptasia diaphana TaxID=2652724 RepID=A0A913XEJ6_EXADI|nr:uncharacterized protein C1orf50 homolog [Exaiptasia diaphana]KXJ12942.1 Uncharacterized protein C1orf50-like [Exaiptasia diaphana]